MEPRLATWRPTQRDSSTPPGTPRLASRAPSKRRSSQASETSGVNTPRQSPRESPLDSPRDSPREYEGPGVSVPAVSVLSAAQLAARRSAAPSASTWSMSNHAPRGPAWAGGGPAGGAPASAGSQDQSHHSIHSVGSTKEPSEVPELIVSMMVGMEERLAKRIEKAVLQAPEQAPAPAPAPAEVQEQLIHVLLERFAKVESQVKGITSLRDDVVHLQAGSAALKTAIWQVDAKMDALSSQWSSNFAALEAAKVSAAPAEPVLFSEPSAEPPISSFGKDDYEDVGDQSSLMPDMLQSHRSRLESLHKGVHANLDIFLSMKDKISQQQEEEAESEKRSATSKMRELCFPPSGTNNCIKRIGLSPPYRMFCTFMILFQVAIVGSEMDQKMGRTIDIGLCSEGLGPPAEAVDFQGYFYIELLMMVWMVIELAINVYTTGALCSGEGHGWNIFDLSILVASVVQLMLSRLSVGFLRVMRLGRLLKFVRLARLVKVMKIFRVLKLLHGVRKMILSMIGSLTSLFWALILMFFMIYLSGVLLMQGVEIYFENEMEVGSLIEFANCTAAGASLWMDNVTSEWPVIDQSELPFENPDNLSPWQQVGKYYGSVERTMTTFFLTVSGGAEWATVADPVMRLTAWFKILWMLFICFMIFGVLNILTGIFVDAALQAAQSDRHAIIVKEKDDQEEATKTLREAFAKIDSDHSGTVTEEEFHMVFLDEEVGALLHHLGVDTSDAAGFFRLMDENHTGVVNVEEFVQSCMNLRGAAKRIDAVTLMSQNKRLAMANMTQIDMIEELWRETQLLKQHTGLYSRSPSRSPSRQPTRRGGGGRPRDEGIEIADVPAGELRI